MPWYGRTLVGLAILAAVATSSTSGVIASAPGAQARGPVLTAGFQWALLAAAAFAVMGTVLAGLPLGRAHHPDVASRPDASSAPETPPQSRDGGHRHALQRGERSPALASSTQRQWLALTLKGHDNA
jgi:hypothetical protein